MISGAVGAEASASASSFPDTAGWPGPASGRERQAVPTIRARDAAGHQVQRRARSCGGHRGAGSARRVDLEVPGRPGLAEHAPHPARCRLSTLTGDQHGDVQLVGGRVLGGGCGRGPVADLADHRPAVDQRHVALDEHPVVEQLPRQHPPAPHRCARPARSPPARRAPSTARAQTRRSDPENSASNSAGTGLSACAAAAGSRRCPVRRGGGRNRPSTVSTGVLGVVDLGEHPVVRADPAVGLDVRGQHDRWRRAGRRCSREDHDCLNAASTAAPPAADRK